LPSLLGAMHPTPRRDPVSTARPVSLVIAHWTTALLLTVAAGTFLARECVEATSARAVLLAVHEQAGMWVLVTVLLRLVLRLQSSPAPSSNDAAWQRGIAAAVHGLLYLATLSMPLLGWAAAQARGEAIRLLGVPLPTWIRSRDLDLADDLIERHGLVAWALLALVLLHVAAALWHHFVLHDGLLRRMWPWGAVAKTKSSTTRRRHR